MTATQHGGTLKHSFLHYITIKIMLDFFPFFPLFFSSFLSDLVSRHLTAASQNIFNASGSGNRRSGWMS
jgi:hypothetical protein